jgi:hypothetical protein
MVRATAEDRVLHNTLAVSENWRIEGIERTVEVKNTCPSGGILLLAERVRGQKADRARLVIGAMQKRRSRVY